MPKDQINPDFSVNKPVADELVVVWTSSDRDVALKMVFMYLANAADKGWWKTITLISWGPSSHLASVDREVQASLKRLLARKVILRSCRTCADLYGVTSELEDLGFEVTLMGEPLTIYLKNPVCTVLTF